MPSCSFQLQFSNASGAGWTLAARFADGRPELTLGSSPDADLFCQEPGVDARHARFRLLDSMQIVIEAVNAESAIRVNGASLDGPRPLADGDLIEIGTVRAKVSGLPASAASAAAPAPRSDSRKIEIPKSEHLRRAPQSASGAGSPVASSHSTPPPEPQAPQPIIGAQAPSVVTPTSAPPAPSIATLRPVGPGTSRPGSPSSPGGSPPAAPSTRGDSSASTRLRLATLRPATLRASPPEPPAEPVQPPTRSIPPPSVQMSASPTGGVSLETIVSRMVATAKTDLPSQCLPYTDAHLRALAMQARSNAQTLGFATDDQATAYFKCIILTGDDLASADSRFPDIYFCLTLQGKPPEARIERALKIANRVNARGGVGLAPMPTIDTSLTQAAGPVLGSTPADEQISEEILPSDAKHKSASPPPTPVPPSNRGASQPHHPRASGQPAASGQAPSAARPRDGKERDATQPLGQAAPPAPRSPAHNEPPPPEKLPEIEGFKILEKIGSGGMGTVYRAYHHRLEVEVAIKVFKSLHPEAKTLLLREARAAARLQHPNIVQVLDYQEFGKGAYYAMQLVKGEDAHEVIVRVSGRMVHEAETDGVIRALGITNDQLSPEARSILQGKQPWHRLVAWWMAGVADGLDRAHREGIVHRDIKPSNLLLARDGRMTITDFGLALRRDDPTVGGNTARAGTPRYLAPERIADWASGADLSGTDGRIDTWALGATMYELLTYRPAYDGARESVMRDIVTADPLPPTQVIWAVPPELDRICMTAMRRNPEERFQQAGEMASALRAWLMGDPGPKGSGQAGVFKRFKK